MTVVRKIATAAVEAARKALKLAAAVMAAGALAAGAAQAQPVPSVPGPYNIDVGAVVTVTAKAPGNYFATSCGLSSTTAGCTPVNLAYTGVVCDLLTGNPSAANSGSASVSFDVQGYDAATASWQTLVTAGRLTNNTPAVLSQVQVAPGIQTTSLPAGIVGAASLRLPRIWRIAYTVYNLANGITGNSTAATFTIGCNLVK